MRNFFCLVLIFLSGLCAYPQLNLHISNVTGLPVFPIDTAFENTSYQVDITVVNDDTAQFNDSLEILIQAGSGTTDILYSDSAFTIIPSLDSIILHQGSYQLLPSHFDDGDNIVVVWPRAKSSGLTGDSSYLDVYFISLIASAEKIDSPPFILSSNPFSTFIALRIPEGIAIRQVRISDISGREVYRNNSATDFISTASWSCGLFFLELEKADGSVQTLRLLKN